MLDLPPGGFLTLTTRWKVSEEPKPKTEAEGGAASIFVAGYSIGGSGNRSLKGTIDGETAWSIEEEKPKSGLERAWACERSNDGDLKTSSEKKIFDCFCINIYVR